MQSLESRLGVSGPQTDDELHQWVRHNLGVNIPRNAVCEDHQAPFKFISDVYFGRCGSALVMASRSGSKTYSAAILHLLNMLYKPGYQCGTVGAIEEQGDRAYAHFRQLASAYEAKTGNKIIQDSIKKKTVLKNKSQLEIYAGTKSGVNGPHPNCVHVDEVELMDPEVYEESRLMSAGTNKDGKLYPAVDIITSTRKRGVGPMQTIIDQINEAKLGGFKPPYEQFSWCIYEVAENQPGCQVANLDNGCESCDCHLVQSGRWDNGSPRTLKDVCKGKFAKSDGWITRETIVNVFTKTSQSTWEAQQECSRPSTAGVVMPQFSIERHGVRGFIPDPDNGPIYLGVDWGGTNAHAVGWFQSLRFDTEVTGCNGEKKILTEGTRVLFDELYVANISNTQLADRVIHKENNWKKLVPNFRVSKRFSDPQGKSARLEWARYKTPLPTVWLTDRDVKEQIKECSYLLEQDKFIVDLTRCEMYIQEIESWHYPKKKAGAIDDPEIPVDDFDHMMSVWRYAMYNIAKIERSGTKIKTLPGSSGKIHQTVKGSGTRRAANEIPAYSPNNTGLPKSEEWRLRFGGRAF